MAGAEISRKWSDAYSGKSGQDQTTTDNDGRFVLPEVTRSSLTAGIVPHTPSISCLIEADVAGDGQILVDLDKGNYDRNGEIHDMGRRDRGVRITCTAGIRDSGDGWYWGTCVLDP